MPQPDPAASRAVIIGASEYDTLEPLPAVANNVARLADLVTDSHLWGLPPDNVRVLLNPTSRDDVLDAIHEAATKARDAILVYYAGHGLLEPQTSALHLALPGASLSRLHRALRYDELRREITRSCQALNKVVVLDCCYSGRAMDGFMAASPDMADQAGIEGTYLMTASAETVLALAEPGEDFTAFTAELVDSIERGVPDGPELLDMGTLYFMVRANLIAKGRPEPQERARNDGRSIALLRNRFGGALPAGAEPVERAELYRRPEPPPGYEHTLRRAPQEILDMVRNLRADGRLGDADQLLTAMAGRRLGQELAATLQLLSHAGRDADLAMALAEIARRPSDEIAALWVALREIGELEVVRALLGVVALRPADHVVDVASYLGAAGRSEDDFALLQAAATARPGIQGVINLVAALWTEGDVETIDRLLAAFVAQVDSARMLELADALRAAGREDTAFSLYVRAAAELAGRLPEEIAGIAHAMQSADRNDDACLLIDAALKARPTAGDGMTLAEALWAVGDGALALDAVMRSARLMQEDQVSSMLDLLCSGGHGELALEYCKTVLERRSPIIVVQLVDKLRYRGRPVDANSLLAALPTMAHGDLVFVVRSLVMSGRSDDARRVFNSVQSAEISYKAGLISAWVFGNTISDEADSLIRSYLQLHPDQATAFVEMLAANRPLEEMSKNLYVHIFPESGNAASFYQQLVEAGQADEARLLLTAQLSQAVDAATAFGMADSFSRFNVGAIVVPLLPPHLNVQAEPIGPTRFAVAARLLDPSLRWGFTIREIGQVLDGDTLAAMVAELRKRRRTGTIELLMREIALQRGTEAIPALLQQMSAMGLHQVIEELLQEIRKRRPKPDRRELARLLNKQGQGSWAWDVNHFV